MAELPSTPADGNVKVAWVPTLADASAPTTTELTAVGVIDVSCYLTGDGFAPSLDEAEITDDRLCDTETYQQPGRSTRSLTLTYIDNSNTSDPNEAFSTLIPGTAGYIVVRRGKAYAGAFATTDKVDVWPVKCGKQNDLPPEANSVLKVTQRMFVTGPVRQRATVAA